MLPTQVLEKVRVELTDLNGTGMSAMEMAHRGSGFRPIAQQAEADLRELLAIPPNYKVVFMQGGAQAQFALVPLNLLESCTRADYINTGHWSKRAIAEAARYCTVNVAASSEHSNFTTVPPQSEWQLSEQAAYVHYTPNETSDFHHQGLGADIDDIGASARCLTIRRHLCRSPKKHRPGWDHRCYRA